MWMGDDDFIVLAVDYSFITRYLDESLPELHREHWFLYCISNHMVFRFDGFIEVFRIVELVEDEDLVFCFQMCLLLELLHSVNDFSGKTFDLELFILPGVKDNSGL